mgnify:CR=1 FL=1
MLKLFKINGQSMEPTITSGSYVITLAFSEYNIGNLIVIRINEQFHIVKRITARIDKKYRISSDNKNSSSSLCDYSYSDKSIVGKVIFEYNPQWKFSKFVKCIKNLLRYNKRYANGNN